jgi:hypothetical protein
MVKLTFEPDCLSVDAGATIMLRNTSNTPTRGRSRRFVRSAVPAPGR